MAEFQRCAVGHEPRIDDKDAVAFSAACPIALPPSGRGRTSFSILYRTDWSDSGRRLALSLLSRKAPTATPRGGTRRRLYAVG